LSVEFVGRFSPEFESCRREKKKESYEIKGKNAPHFPHTYYVYIKLRLYI